MLQLDTVAGTTRTPPDAAETLTHQASLTATGRQTVIILDRDGSLRHYPPGCSSDEPRRARIELDEDQAHPTLIARILDFTFDVLGMNSLEVRIHEHPKR
ncbi:MAG: hypothetical protein OHK0015_24860 [Chloroflexi bacterium OHK40]